MQLFLKKLCRFSGQQVYSSLPFITDTIRLGSMIVEEMLPCQLERSLFQAVAFLPIDHDAVFGIMADTLIAVYPLQVQSIHRG